MSDVEETKMLEKKAEEILGELTHRLRMTIDQQVSWHRAHGSLADEQKLVDIAARHEADEVGTTREVGRR